MLIRLVGAVDREVVVVVEVVGSAVGVDDDVAGEDGDAAGTISDACCGVGSGGTAASVNTVGGEVGVGGAAVVSGAGESAKAANCNSKYSRSSWQNRASLGGRSEPSTHSRRPPAINALSTRLRSAADMIT